MLDHVAKRQNEIKESIAKSFMTDGGADVSNGVEKSEDNFAPGSVIKEATQKGEASGYEVDDEMKEEDKKKDKTEMKKSEDNIDFLSSGGFMKAQASRILETYKK